MGTTTLTRPKSGAWLHRLVRDPMVAIGPEAVTLIHLGLADRDVIDLSPRRDAAAPVTHASTDPVPTPVRTRSVPPLRVVHTPVNG